MKFDKRSRLARGLLLALVAAIVAGLVALGNWQLRRLDWKLDLIERIETRVGAAPVAVPPRAEWGEIERRPHEYEYRRVSIHGRFLHEHETLVQALTERGGGYWVLTPLLTTAGDIVMINRGFVPGDALAQWRAAERPAGERRIGGLLRLSEPGGIPLRRNDPAVGRWYSRDVAAIARARDIDRTAPGRIAPYFIDADAVPNPGGLPVGGMTRLVFRNAHLVYALTWYGLALLLVAMSGYAIYRERAGGVDASD